MNLAEQTALQAENNENTEFLWINSWFQGSIVRLSPNKYIDRLEIEFSTEQNGSGFQELCEELWFGHRFLSESVRWSRSDEYLAVLTATFVRWKPVED